MPRLPLERDELLLLKFTELPEDLLLVDLEKLEFLLPEKLLFIELRLLLFITDLLNPLEVFLLKEGAVFCDLLELML